MNMIIGYLLTSFGAGGLLWSIICILYDVRFITSPGFMIMSLIFAAVFAGGIFAIVSAVKSGKRQAEKEQSEKIRTDGSRKDVCPYCGLNISSECTVCPKCGFHITDK